MNNCIYNEDCGFIEICVLESQLQSMKTKGFLRSYRSYNPPADLDSKFLRCVSEILEQKLSDISSVQNMEITSLDLKLKLINALHKEFSHKIYNSRIYQMKTIGDIYTYYKV